MTVRVGAPSFALLTIYSKSESPRMWFLFTGSNVWCKEGEVIHQFYKKSKKGLSQACQLERLGGWSVHEYISTHNYSDKSKCSLRCGLWDQGLLPSDQFKCHKTSLDYVVLAGTQPCIYVSKHVSRDSNKKCQATAAQSSWWSGKGWVKRSCRRNGIKTIEWKVVLEFNFRSSTLPAQTKSWIWYPKI